MYFFSKSITPLQARSCVYCVFICFFAKVPTLYKQLQQFCHTQIKPLVTQGIQKTVSTETHRTNVNPAIRITHSNRELLLNSLTDFQGSLMDGAPYSSLLKRIHSIGKEKQSVATRSGFTSSWHETSVSLFLSNGDLFC